MKGSLVALALDLMIRIESRQRRSLDDLMRLLWRRYGKTGRGVAEHGIEDAVEELLARVPRSRASAARAGAFLRRAVHGTGELPLAELLRRFGIRLSMRPAASASDRGGFVSAPAARSPRRIDLGLRLAAEGEARVTQVLNGRAAERGGLAPGDVIVAVDGVRVLAKSFDARVQRADPGERLQLHFFRRDELRATEVRADPAAADTCDIGFMRGAPTADARRWLRGRRG